MTTPGTNPATASLMWLLGVVLAGVILSSNTSSAGGMNSAKHFPDHFVVGISDLEEGMHRVEELTGVRPVRGGRHPHIGTRNALISLGEHSYLEIIAPDPDANHGMLDPGLKAQFLDPLLQMESLTPYLWAIGSSDLALTAGMLEEDGITLSPPEPGARKKPDGTLLEWRASFVMEPRLDGLPFFIQWADPESAPPKDSPTGCTLHHFEISGPDTGYVERISARLSLPFGTRYATRPGIRIEIDCPNGRIDL